MDGMSRKAPSRPRAKRMRQTPLQPTVREVAAKADVSIGTVSLVVNRGKGCERISEATRLHVLAVAESLGYRTNIWAQGTRRGRFGAFGLLQDTDWSRTYACMRTVNGIAEQLDRLDLRLVYARIADQRLESGQIPCLFRQQVVDGIILDFHQELPEALVQRLDRLALPWVVTNNARAVDAVRPDERLAAAALVDRLALRGHRRIAYLDPNYDPLSLVGVHFSRIERHAGYVEGMTRAGLPLRRISAPTGTPVEDRRALLRSALEGPEAATAVIIAGGLQDFCQVAFHELHRVPGRDLAVVAFSHEEQAMLALGVVPVQVPWTALGAAAVDLLQAKVAGGGQPQPARLVPVELPGPERLAAP